jgi:hypothetical protein
MTAITSEARNMMRGGSRARRASDSQATNVRETFYRLSRWYLELASLQTEDFHLVEKQTLDSGPFLGGKFARAKVEVIERVLHIDNLGRKKVADLP